MMSIFNGSSFSMKTCTSFLECNFFARFVIRGWSFFPATILPCNFFFLSMFACLGPGPQFPLWGFYSNLFGWPIFTKFLPHNFFVANYMCFSRKQITKCFMQRRKKWENFATFQHSFFWSWVVHTHVAK